MSILYVTEQGSRIEKSGRTLLIKCDSKELAEIEAHSLDSVLILGNELASLLEAIGFDPYLGFYHSADYGRPSLALDLLEEFRHCLVDRMVIAALNLKVFKPEDFQHPEEPGGGLRLKREKFKRFLLEMETCGDSPFDRKKGPVTPGLSASGPVEWS